MDSRFAGFWARVLVCVGMLFVLLGFIFAASALVLDMPSLLVLRSMRL